MLRTLSLFSISLAVLGLALTTACSSLKVSSDRDREADFTQYKTYSYMGWAENSDKILNDLDKRRLENAVRAEFDKRGMELVESGGDAVVSLFVVVNQETSTRAYTDYYNMGGYGYGRWGWGMGMGTATTTYQDYHYQTGTLVIDLFDAESKELKWQGVGSGTVNENPANRDKTIPRAIAKIMAQYPIKPVK